MSKVIDDQPATKRDLNELRIEIHDIRDGLRIEIQASEERVIKKVTEEVTIAVTREVTKSITKTIGTEVGSLLSDAMNIIGDKFVGLENQFKDMKSDMSVMKQDIQDLKDGQGRIERKLDTNIAVTDNLLIRTSRLEAKIA